MNQDIEEKYIYSHGYSIENVGSMLSCVFGALVLFYQYFENTQIWILVLAMLLSGLAAFSVDLVVTKISIYADKVYVYIKPCQPVTFKKSYRFKRAEIKKTRVDTSERVTRYGKIVTHTVVLITKDGMKHNILIPRDKGEALRVKKEVSRYRHA
jgi:hypothetical protein